MIVLIDVRPRLLKALMGWARLEWISNLVIFDQYSQENFYQNECLMSMSR